MASAPLTRPDPLPAPQPYRWVVWIDSRGVIQSSDGYWPMVNSLVAVESSYYRVLARICGENRERITAISTGIRAVAEGHAETFNIEFPCRLPDRGIEMRLTASRHPEGVLLLHAEAGLESDTQPLQMEALGRLTGGVVHDFANLLTLISGYSEIVLSRLGPDHPVRAEVKEIRKATAHGFGMTAQILDFVRKPSAAPPATVNLNKLVGEMQNLLRPIIGERISLVTTLDPHLGDVPGCPAQIAGVLMNLVLNARDAMPDGGRISIRTANAPPPGRYVTLEVADTGCGMDSETVRKIFQPFFTSGKPGGTGLGLANVRRTVQQMAGDIQVRSEPGRGTVFTICLPRAPQAPQGSVTTGLRTAAGPGAETILLAEDEESVRKLLKHLLAGFGYQVIDAKDGQEALRIFLAAPGAIDLLLTDVMMPGMTGRELARHAAEAKPHLKVIYMSGYTDEAQPAAGGPLLRKPLKLDVLTSLIRQVLDAPASAG